MGKGVVFNAHKCPTKNHGPLKLPQHVAHSFRLPHRYCWWLWPFAIRSSTSTCSTCRLLLQLPRKYNLFDLHNLCNCLLLGLATNVDLEVVGYNIKTLDDMRESRIKLVLVLCQSTKGN